MFEEILKRLDNFELLLKFNKTFLALDEAVYYLQLSKSHVYKMKHTLKIPFYKPDGKKVYFHRDDLDRCI